MIKWYPTGNMAWRKIVWNQTIHGNVRVENTCDCGRVYELVREFVELDIGEMDVTPTGNYEWRPIPILPDNPPPPVPSGLLGIPDEDYPGKTT